MLLVDALVLGVVVGLIRKGSFAALQDVRLRFELSLVALLVFQAVLPGLSDGVGLPGPLALELWLLAMCLLAGLAIANSQHTGMLLAALGVAANALVIALNSGMPVLLTAYVPIGGSPIDPSLMAGDLLHVPLSQGTALGFLADIVPIPGPHWHRAVVSVGDLLLCIGAGWFIAHSMTLRRLK